VLFLAQGDLHPNHANFLPKSLIYRNAMLRISNLTLRRGEKVLLDQASLSVSPGHKVGLVGANGCGKSSLFALLRHELHQDAGEFDVPPRWVIAYVAQETPATERPAIDYVQDGDVELR